MKDGHANTVGHFAAAGFSFRGVKTGKKGKPEEIVSKESRYVRILESKSNR